MNEWKKGCSVKISIKSINAVRKYLFELVKNRGRATKYRVLTGQILKRYKDNSSYKIEVNEQIYSLKAFNGKAKHLKHLATN